MTTNAERQRKCKAKKRYEGLMQVQIWIQPDRKKILESYAKALRECDSPSKP